MFRAPLVTGAVVAIALLIQATPGAAQSLQFDRHAIAAGEIWRLLTSHVTHFDFNHLAWDALVLVTFGSLCEVESRRRTTWVIAAAAVTISAAVWCFQPRFDIYRGLSGIDCALFGMFTASIGRRKNRASRVLAIVATSAVLAKCAFELATDSTLFASGHGYAPVPLAHGVGFVTGLITGAIGQADALRTRHRVSASASHECEMLNP